jgi:hypothetical protein
VTAHLHKASLLLILLAVAGCDRAGRPARTLTSQSGLKVAERNQILSWLQCEECVDGELERVALLGKKEAAAVDSLGEDLLGGPSARRRSNIRQQTESSYVEDSVYAVSVGSQLPGTRSKYVDHYLDNFMNLYRIRAARALAEIGGPKAAAILDSAAHGHVRTPGDTLRADAQLNVLFARDSILGGFPGVRRTLDSAP